jgi:hypothetical protein
MGGESDWCQGKEKQWKEVLALDSEEMLIREVWDCCCTAMPIFGEP